MFSGEFLQCIALGVFNNFSQQSLVFLVLEFCWLMDYEILEVYIYEKALVLIFATFNHGKQTHWYARITITGRQQ